MAQPVAGSHHRRLGTFAGVFTPSILTILGIILFLRLGYVVGAAGLERALLVIALANAISLLTSLSVAAISTNLKVKGGGDYYLISRTLGVAFGGAIGLVLFLAQSISVGFYCMGFAEAVAALSRSHDAVSIRLIAAAAVLGLSGLAWLGADWATRFQYVVMAAIGAALVAFAAGGAIAWNGHLLAVNLQAPDGGLAFWAAFAVFFPAVTGFTQGVSMSGELRDPARSIPRGVLSAVVLSTLIYVGCAAMFAAALPGDVLATDFSAMKRVALLPLAVDAGVVAATLSSALASLLGAPRILQSLARDDVFTRLRLFAHGSGASGNPRRAVVLSVGIALAVVAIGDLNLVASVVTMFFLISYGLLNYATYFESRAGSPSFRPTFRFYRPWVGLLGFVSCLVAMLAIDLAAGATAVAIVFSIYKYLELSDIPARWADSRRSHHLHEARQHLLAAAAEPEHPRDWRPQLLVFSDSTERRRRLVRFASWIEGGSGLTTVIRILEGHGPAMVQRREETGKALSAELKDAALTAFPLVVAADDVDAAVSTVVQAAGIGPIAVNTVVVNWISEPSATWLPLAPGRFGRNLRTAFRLGCNLLILDCDAREWEALSATPAAARVIDVWWRENQTGELMLLLAHLMTRSGDWQDCRIRMLAEAKPDETSEQASDRLKSVLDTYRIEAEIVVGAAEHERIVAESRGASMVFLPFNIHGDRFYGPSGAEVAELLAQLPTVVLVLAAQDVDLGATPDSDDPPAEAPAGGDIAEPR